MKNNVLSIKIANRERCEHTIIDLVNSVGIETFMLGLSDAFYGDGIKEGCRRLRRDLDDKLSDLVNWVQGE